VPHRIIPYEVGILAIDWWAVTFGTARGDWGRSPPRPLLAVPNVTAYTSKASVGLPSTVLLSNGPLLCGSNVLVKGLTCSHKLTDG